MDRILLKQGDPSAQHSNDRHYGHTVYLTCASNSAVAYSIIIQDEFYELVNCLRV